jgi:hypothetical protein
MADYQLNPLLTDAAWQKNKGAYAKMAGETGMGAALARMNSAYKAVDWEFIDLMPIFKKEDVMGWGKAKVLERQKFAKKNCTNAGVFETELGKVIAVTKATDTKFRNSKLPNISTGKNGSLISSKPPMTWSLSSRRSPIS